MVSGALNAEIERLSARRQAIWRGDEEADPGEITRISTRLNDLYEERRIADARDRSGDRTEITRRAKVETELERLMTG